jgi:NADPH:quinone reductase-like Zn-dependent oxidoreductase
MKAIVYHRYGSPDVLQYHEIERPTPADNQVLMKIGGASINPMDRGELGGLPYIFRMVFGLPKPSIMQPARPGVDVAGQVEGVGSKVTEFRPGDEVFGVCVSNPRAPGVRAWVHHEGLLPNTPVFRKRRWF